MKVKEFEDYEFYKVMGMKGNRIVYTGEWKDLISVKKEWEQLENNQRIGERKIFYYWVM